MKREFAINILILLVLSFLIKVFYLIGIDRQFQLVLGITTYGLYYQLVNFTLLFQFINDFGIQNFTNRHVSQNRETIQFQYKEFVTVKILLSLCYGGIIFIVARWTNTDKENFPILMQIAGNQVLVSAIFFVRANIAGLGYYKTDSFFSILDRVLLIILGSFLLWEPSLKNSINLQSFVWIQTISLGLTLLCIILFAFSKQLRFVFGRINLVELKKIGLGCIPFAFIFLFSSLYSKLDVLLISKLLESGREEAGIYAASMRLFEAASMMSLAFGSLLLGMFSVLYQDPIRRISLFKSSMNLLVILTVAVVTISCFYAQEIMELLYHQNDAYWTSIFTLTMLAFFPASLNFIYGALFQAIHLERKLLIYYFLAFIFSVLLNFYMIIHWRVIGAAYVSLLIHSSLLLIQSWYLQKNGFLKLDYLFWLRIVIFIVIAVLLVYSIRLIEFNWLVKSISSTVIIITIAFVFRMISFKEIIKTQNKEVIN